MTVRDYRALYGNFHRMYKNLAGFSTGKIAREVKRLVDIVKPERMLDYGCGKGMQYLHQRLHESWGGMLPYCYDIGVPAISTKPEGVFEGILCCDVMEHIDPQDVDEILDDIFISTNPDRLSFVAFQIDIHPSKKVFKETMEDLHLCVQPPEWWMPKFDRFKRDNLIISVNF